MNRIQFFILILFYLITLNTCITVIAQTPDSVGMPKVLREEAKEQSKKGDKRVSNLLNAAADSIEAGDKNARAAIKGEKKTQKENASLQREAGWGDGLQSLGWFTIILMIGIALILVLIFIIKGKIRIPFISKLLSLGGGNASTS
ncbi:hypothetical protein [Leptospira interrogans]|uniref:Uncharacterized protein n=3 Tax=Leptospira interrogans TaxID=173 RepID=A0AAP9WK68_LEPIR|nr:hypothetical protein [Leptospira interrogans]KAA1287466.1 hypothetical protein C4X99_23310 [Leptospira interrogans serovar Geyaweera]EKR27490.1 hypothetical protein LEP1GSC087_2561 [Leptospira interrogans serovar Bataviae str. L1111]EKR55539.1 hypothetical protein LEP1GSC105_2197 [Leptospira interrogans str. UI 12758]EKR82844.1 hypothetical protein LEP1GSC099_4354 [Leptospira interrogans str. UI 08452]EMJ53858.1 hypothetical protein LEP1GSC111_0134 [Leptospira interrogans str. UT126]